MADEGERIARRAWITSLVALVVGLLSPAAAIWVGYAQTGRAADAAELSAAAASTANDDARQSADRAIAAAAEANSLAQDANVMADDVRRIQEDLAQAARRSAADDVQVVVQANVLRVVNGRTGVVSGLELHLYTNYLRQVDELFNEIDPAASPFTRTSVVIEPLSTCDFVVVPLDRNPGSDPYQYFQLVYRDRSGVRWVRESFTLDVGTRLTEYDTAGTWLFDDETDPVVPYTNDIERGRTPGC